MLSGLWVVSSVTSATMASPTMLRSSSSPRCPTLTLFRWKVPADPPSLRCGLPVLVEADPRPVVSRDFALEPAFDGVLAGRDDTRRGRRVHEVRGEVLVPVTRFFVAQAPDRRFVHRREYDHLAPARRDRPGEHPSRCLVGEEVRVERDSKWVHRSVSVDV